MKAPFDFFKFHPSYVEVGVLLKHIVLLLPHSIRSVLFFFLVHLLFWLIFELFQVLIVLEVTRDCCFVSHVNINISCIVIDI